MTTRIAPQCLYCRRYYMGDNRMGFRCEAFPNGIPEDILWWQVDHQQSVDGDRGLRFDPLDQKAAETVEERWRWLRQASQQEDVL